MATEGSDLAIVSDALEYHADELTFRGRYVRLVSPPLARRAVIIAPDWRGLSDYSIERAEQLARLGHDVLVADLYGGGLCATEESQAKPLIQGLVQNRPGLVRRMQAGLSTLLETLPRATPVAALGYSIGGMALLDLGRSGAPLAGIVLASALLRVAEPGAATKIAAPLLVLQGTRDVVCPMDVVSALVSEMDSAANELQMVLYGQTGHAFYNREAGDRSERKALLFAVGRPTLATRDPALPRALLLEHLTRLPTLVRPARPRFGLGARSMRGDSLGQSGRAPPR